MHRMLNTNMYLHSIETATVRELVVEREKGKRNRNNIVLFSLRTI